jgi:hypothetical protein
MHFYTISCIFMEIVQGKHKLHKKQKGYVTLIR